MIQEIDIKLSELALIEDACERYTAYCDLAKSLPMDSDDFRLVWAAIEDLKNRFGGFPPEPKMNPKLPAKLQEFRLAFPSYFEM